MSSSFTGIITQAGINEILVAGESAGIASISSFAISAVTGSLDPYRVNPNPTWYTGEFNSAPEIHKGDFIGDIVSGTNVITNIPSTSNLNIGLPVVGEGIPIGTAIVSIDSPSQITLNKNVTQTSSGLTFNYNVIDISILIPPSSVQLPLADGSLIAEIYLITSMGTLFGIIQPPDNIPITYSELESYEIDMQLQFTISSSEGTFVFVYTPGNIEAHNLDPNAHQRRWVLKAGDTMLGALHTNTSFTELASANGSLILDETGNSYIVNGSEDIDSITGWSLGEVTILWNSERTLKNSDTLQLIDDADRTTTIGDIGVYQFNSTGCIEISYAPIGNYAYKHGNSEVNFDVAEPVLDSNAVNLGYFRANSKSYKTYCVNSGNVDTYGKGLLLYTENPSNNTAINFKVGTTEYYSDYNYGYINKAGAGASTIGYTNNIYTFNGTNQFLTVPKIPTFGTGTWSIQRKIKFNVSGTNEGIMGNGATGSSFGISLQRQITSNKLMLKISSNGTSWDLLDGSTTLKGLGDNAFNSTSSYYWFKVYFNGSSYKVDYSLDGTTWTNDIQVNLPSTINPSLTQLCLGTNGSYFLNGSEDMSGAKFIISENTVFEGDLIYAAPNITVTFPNNRTYEISSIADLTGLSTDGPYKIIIEEDNLIKLENGTYHAIATAVKINYSFTGKLPNIYSAVSPGGYSTSYVGVKGLNSYDLFNGSGTGIYWMGQGSGSYPTDTGGVSTFILNMSTLKTISSVAIESRAVSNSTNLYTHTHYASGVYISFSVDGGSTYGTRTFYALNPGLNTIDIAPTSTNVVKFEFPSVGDVNVGGHHGGYYDVWWVGLSIGSVSVIETVSYAGGIITEDYALAASTSTINYTPIQQSPIFTSNTQDGFVLSGNVPNGTEYQMFDGNNSTTYMFTNGGWAGGTFNYMTIYNPTAFIMKEIQIYSTNPPSVGGVANGIGNFSVQGSNDGSNWTAVASIPNSNFNNTLVNIDNDIAYKYYLFSVGINLFGGNQGWHGSWVNEVRFGYTTAYTSNNSNVGDYFLNLSSIPNVAMKNIDDIGWIKKQYLKLGEVTKAGGILGTPITYAYNGTYEGAFASYIANNLYIVNHNIGTDNCNLKVRFSCITAEKNYAVGDKLDYYQQGGFSSNWTIAPFLTKNTSGWNCYVGVPVFDKTTGVGSSLTSANWQWKIIAKRSF